MNLSPSVSSRLQEASVASVGAPAQGTPIANAAWGPSFICALVVIFILYSRFFDLAATGWRIPRIILSLMILLFLFSGRLWVFLRSTTGKLMLLFLFWCSFTLIFSVWRTGSLPPYVQLLEGTLIFAVAASLPLVLANVRRLTCVLALSGLVAALMSVPFGSSQLGRLALSQGSYVDPNYYAMALVVIVPLLWEMAVSAESLFVKLFAWLGFLPIIATLARTGSRGAMLAFGVTLLVLFLISPIKTKFVLLVFSTVSVIALMAVIPAYVRDRYLTYFTADPVAAQPEVLSDYSQLQADASSAEARKRLLLTSIALTFEHPLVGVGPGNFPTAVYDESKASGHTRNEWLVTHNSYTQISSETGIIGFLIFVCLLGSAFKNVIFVYRRSKEEGVKPNQLFFQASKYLLLSMFALSVCIFFLAVGYEFTTFLFAGITVSLRRAYEELPEPAMEKTDLSDLAESETRHLAPAYARKVGPPVTAPAKRPTAAVEGRAVRFTRFR